MGRSLNATYLCEQGQNPMTIASGIVTFVLGAGTAFSIDSLLGLSRIDEHEQGLPKP